MRDAFYFGSEVQIGSDPRSQTVDQRAHAAPKGNHLLSRTRPALAQSTADKRSMLALELPELGKGMLGRKSFRIAGIDTADKRFDGAGEDFGTEATAHQIGQRFIFVGASRDEGFGQHANFSGKGKERRGDRTGKTGGQRDGCTATQEEALLGLWRDDFVIQSLTAQEVGHRGVVQHHGIRTALDEKTPGALRANRTAGLRG